MTIGAGEELLAGRYRVRRRLGAGGMATVALAEDERLGRLVAVKRVRADAPDETLARLRREARLGASLTHPNLVSIYDADSDPDSVLIVMEYVEGRSLDEILDRGRLDPARALPLLRGVAGALDHAHGRGVVHRDVKPANVLVARDGTAKLADLGIAAAVDATRITAAHTVLGTLPYVSPERLTGELGGPPADIYALAVLAYETLSGQPVRRGRTPAEVVDRAASEPPPDLRDAWPAAPAAAAHALRRGMAADPAERPPSAGELVRDLEAAFAPAPPAKATQRLPAATEPLSDAKRRGAPSWLVPLVVLALLGVTALAISSIGGGEGDRPATGGGPTRPDESPAPGESARAGVPRPSGLDDPVEGGRLNSEGFALIGEGRYEEAIPILRRAVAAFPARTTDLSYAYALFNLGNALRLAGRPEEAIPVLERRLLIDNQRDVVQRELDLARAEASR